MLFARKLKRDQSHKIGVLYERELVQYPDLSSKKGAISALMVDHSFSKVMAW